VSDGNVEYKKNIGADNQAADSKKKIELAPAGKKPEKMLLHGFDIERGRDEAYKKNGIGINQVNQPFSAQYLKVGMKKLNEYRSGKNKKNMIDAADQKSFSR